jgi:hypothetical protein
MKKTITLLGSLLILSCSNTEYSPKYSDFDNDWERENLIGKVKTIEQYKANVTDSRIKDDEMPIIQIKKEFTETGKISYEEYFDSFGRLEYYNRNEFDSKDYKVNSTSENFVTSSKSVQTNTFDTLISKIISVNINFNDSSYLSGFFKYDKKDNLIAQLSIENGDTTSNIFEYNYAVNGKILSKKQIQRTENGIYEYLNEFKYDLGSNLIELKNISEFSETSITYEYDNKSRIKKIAESNYGKIEKETFFDKFYNQTLVIFYKNGSIIKEMKFDYELDKTGNWIKRKVFVKEYTRQEIKWIPIYSEIRKIEYYD